MKKIFGIILVLLFLFCVPTAEAANAVRAFGCLIGGAAGCVDESGLNSTDGDLGFAIVSNVIYIYEFDGVATDAEVSPNFIRPDDYSDGGVWYLVSVRAMGFTASPSADPKTTLLDSDGAGAAETDKYAGGFNANFSTVTEDAEVADVWHSYYDAGTSRSFSFWDASDWAWYQGVMTDAAAPATVATLEALKWDFDTATDNQVLVSTPSGVTEISFSAINLVTTGTFGSAKVTSTAAVESSGLFDVTGATSLTLGSADVTSWILSGMDETLTITPSADLVTMTTGTGVATFDFGTINLATDALDLSDGNITNVGSIALDSIGADDTNISIVAASGTVTVEDVVFTGGALSGVTAITGLTTPLATDLGGTGVANNAASTLTISGNYATTLTVTEATGVTLPASGTLATVAGNIGAATATTPAENDNDTSVATTAYVQTEISTLATLASPTFTGIVTAPIAADPTTDADGEMSFDTDGWGSGYDALEIWNGTASAYVVATTASDTPTNGQVPKWNTGGTITWEDDSTGAGSLGSNLASTTNDITSDNNAIQLVANSEDLVITASADLWTLTTTTDVATVDFGTINLATDALDLSDGSIANVTDISLDTITSDAGTTIVVNDDLHVGADDAGETLTVHSAGTVIMYDASDDFAVTLGPVADGTTTLGVTGSLSVSAGVTAATMTANYTIVTPQSLSVTTEDDVTVGTELTSSVVLLTGDDDSDDDTLTLQDGVVAGTILTFICVAGLDAVDDALIIDAETDSTCLGCPDSGIFTYETAGSTLTLYWTGAAWTYQGSVVGE